MSIGDVNSNAPGSGARFNDGKPNLALIPGSVLARVYHAYEGGESFRRTELSISDIAEALELFQNEGLTRPLILALAYDPKKSLTGAARVFEYGAKKYAAWNWLKGMPWSVPFACAHRHLLAAMTNEPVDAESGYPHLSHVWCNVIMLVTFADMCPELDDITMAVIGPKREELVACS